MGIEQYSKRAAARCLVQRNYLQVFAVCPWVKAFGRGKNIRKRLTLLSNNEWLTLMRKQWMYHAKDKLLKSYIACILFLFRSHLHGRKRPAR